MDVGQYHIPAEHFTAIGSGAFSRVFQAQRHGTCTWYALKIIRLDKRALLKDERLDREIAILEKIGSHPNIVQFIEKFEHLIEVDMPALVLVFEYCNSNTLSKYIEMRGAMKNEAEIHHFLSQLRDALSQLHKHHFMHRDVKTTNILLHREQSRARASQFSSFQLKLADFDFACECFEDDEEESNITKTICGSPITWAPETLDSKGKQYTRSSEMWSIGLVLYEMCYGKQPFADKKQMNIKMLSNLLQVYPLHLNLSKNTEMSAELKSLLISLLHNDSKQRMTWNQFIEHPFFVKHAAVSQEEEKSPANVVVEPIAPPVPDGLYHFVPNYYTIDEKQRTTESADFTSSKPIPIPGKVECKDLIFPSFSNSPISTHAEFILQSGSFKDLSNSGSPTSEILIQASSLASVGRVITDTVSVFKCFADSVLSNNSSNKNSQV